MGLWSLQHMKGSEVHLSRARPPATFHLQGLVTLLAVYSLRSRAGFVSHRPRSWDLPFGAFPSGKVSEGISLRKRPLTVSPIGVPAAVALGRPNRSRFPGFAPCRSPWPRGEGLVRPWLDAPLGFALLGYSGEDLVRDFARSPLTRFAGWRMAMPAGAPEYQSVFARPNPRLHAGDGQGNPLRVCAPARSWAFERAPFRAMGSPLTATRITAVRPVIFGWMPSLYRSCQDRLRC
jgi:hypothetical protein